MLSDIPGYRLQSRFYCLDHPRRAHSPFEFSFLFRRQAVTRTFEPGIERRGVEGFRYNATLIEERHNSLVLHRTRDWVGIDELAEFQKGVSRLVLEQRRAGEADITGIRQHPAHVFVHRIVIAVLAAMALIDENKDVRTVGRERPFPHA